MHPPPAHVNVGRALGAEAAQLVDNMRHRCALQVLDGAGKVVDQLTSLKELKLAVGVYAFKTNARGAKTYAVIQSMDHESVSFWSPDKLLPLEQRSFSALSEEVVEEWRPVMDAGEVADNGLIMNWELLGPDLDSKLLAANVKAQYHDMLYRVWHRHEGTRRFHFGSPLSRVRE